MSDILDDIRRQLGLPPEHQDEQQVAGSLEGGGDAAGVPHFLQGCFAEFEANAKAYAEEMAELHKLGYEYNGRSKRQ